MENIRLRGKAMGAMTAALAMWVLAVVPGSARDARPAFDGQRAYQFLTMQTDLGPRNPGSAGWAAFQDKARDFLDSLGVTCIRQPFEFVDTADGDTMHMANWIIRINPDSSDRILIGTHYDTRPWADKDPDSTRRKEPIPGANDGASGTAVLLHLAEILEDHPPAIGVDLVLFDGEDSWERDRLDKAFLGSTYFAANPPDTFWYWYGVVIDMIGDRDLQIYREEISETYIKPVNDIVFAAAKRLNLPQVFDSVGHRVGDDHTALSNGGVPSVVVIDFDYPYWHTHEDTPDKCSPASLEIAGRWMLEIIDSAIYPWDDSADESDQPSDPGQ
jgi:glutaminyl-peptide cyclotransferase